MTLHKIISLLIVLLVTLPFLYLQMQMLQGLNRTSENFDIVKSTPGNLQFQFAQTTNPEIVFSQPIGISEKELSSYFSITPFTHGLWRLDRTKRIVSFMSRDITKALFPTIFKPNTLYTLTITKKLPSKTKKTLGRDITITFKTQPKQAIKKITH